MNMSDYNTNLSTITEIFDLFSQSARLNIVLAIGSGHACVCHLEAVLGLRQAYISQQLMLMRSAGLVETERCGKHIFYHLSDPQWLTLIQRAAELKKIELPIFELPEIDGCVYSGKSCKSNK
jgi:ArsR family transcriptional regulator